MEGEEARRGAWGGDKEQEIPSPVGETGLISQDRKQFQKREGSESLPEAPICRQHSAPLGLRSAGFSTCLQVPGMPGGPCPASPRPLQRESLAEASQRML